MPITPVDRPAYQHAQALSRTERVHGRPDSPEEAAAQFEEILARQFVQEMTKGLFESTLSGDDGPGWMKGYASQQTDVLTDVLTKHLVDSGTLNLRNHLLRQWQQKGQLPQEDAPIPDAGPQPETLLRPNGLSLS